MIAKIKVIVRFLRPPVCVFSTSTIFRDEAVSPFTTQPRNFFTFRKDNANFAASWSVPKISTKSVSRERLMFLHPSEKAYDTTLSAERNKKLVRQKRICFKEVSVEEVAKNGNK